jgi:hypothetical protein
LSDASRTVQDDSAKHAVVYELVPYEAKPGTGGKSVLSADGQVVAEGHIRRAALSGHD